MEKNIFKVDLSNSPWDSACFRSKVVGTKEVIYKLMENGSFADSENKIGATLYFLSLLEKAVPLINDCSPNDSVEFPKIENSKELVKELIKRILPAGVFNMGPDYLTLAEKLEVTASTGKGVFIYGGTARGKSTFLLGLSQWLKDNKYPFIFSTYSHDNKIFDFMNNFQEGVIILDDVNDGWDIKRIFEFVLDRVEKSWGKYRLFAASRLSFAEFVETYGSRCASILNTVCSLVEFQGDSFRKEVILKC